MTYLIVLKVKLEAVDESNSSVDDILLYFLDSILEQLTEHLSVNKNDFFSASPTITSTGIENELD